MQDHIQQNRVAEITIKRSFVTLVSIPVLVVIFHALIVWMSIYTQVPINEQSVTLVFFVFGTIVIAVVHELLHGFAYFSDKCVMWKDIKIGVNMRLLSPFCSCNAPVRLNVMRRVLVAPFVGTGLLSS